MQFYQERKSTIELNSGVQKQSLASKDKNNNSIKNRSKKKKKNNNNIFSFIIPHWRNS
jgi:hypothetical protein